MATSSPNVTASCLTDQLLRTWQPACSLTFPDLKGIPRQGFLAVARQSIGTTLSAGTKYCLSFVGPSDPAYSPHQITVHFYRYQSRMVFACLGTYAYRSVDALLSDVEPASNW